MSNLGMYQNITKWSKMCGGPLQFLGLVAVGGYVIIRLGEFGVKKVIKKAGKNEQEIKSFIVNKHMDLGEIEFNIGDQFKLLAVDGNAALIELVGNKNNPYFVSVELLKELSDYE